MKKYTMHLLYLLLFLLAITNKGEALDAGIITGFRAAYNLEYKDKLENADTYLKYDYANSLSIKLTTGIRISDFRIVGVYENTMFQEKWDSYTPIQDAFTVKISYSFLDFEIVVESKCIHPVITPIDTREIFSNSGRRFISLSYYKEF